MLDEAQVRTALTNLRSTISRLQHQIGQLNQANQAQTAGLIAVNAKTQRTSANLSNLATGLTTVTVTWPTAWPDTQYGIWITVLPTASALGLVAATYNPNLKTAVDCQIVLNNSSSGTVPTVVLDILGDRT